MAGSAAASCGGEGRLLVGKRYSNSHKMSSTPSHNLAPFLINSWQPLLRGESMRPGTAKTWRPASTAMPAVIKAPLVRLASTTTVPNVIPATIRLRMGKDCLVPGRLKGNWVIKAPFADILSKSCLFSEGQQKFMKRPSTDRKSVV